MKIYKFLYMNLSLNDTKGIIDVSKGLSLIDSYWIVQDENLKFSDYNLFDNDFSEVLSLIAFTGYSSKMQHQIHLKIKKNLKNI